ncbi:MAG: DUF1775 domain-containing protein [Gemmatimonadetes bacterium]|nr:DUF1775 domain-containing protein [Gemmatimonadota bacterium]
MNTSRLSAILALTAVVLLASAHVTVSPREIVSKGGGVFLVNVPTERPVATVKIRVEFPEGLRVSRIRAKAGWTAAVERDTSKAITAVTWSGGKIGPDEFDEFAFNARVNAPPSKLAFKAYQTYEGGETVAWTSTDTPTPKDQHPAPQITITPVQSKYATAARENWLGATAMLLGFAALTMSMRNGRNGKKVAGLMLFALAALAAAAPLAAQDHAARPVAVHADAQAAAPTGRPGTAAEQIAGAVIAAPPELRDDATVLGYAPDGKFIQLRKGTGDMICLADDPKEARFHVACYHKSLEPFMARGRELTAQGVEGWPRDSVRNSEIASGRIKMPAAGGLYTLTARAGCYDAATGKLCDHTNPVHSVYVPFASIESTGLLDHPTDEHTPFLMNAGTAKAHIMFGKHEH